MKPTIPVYGYGHNPHETGVLMAMCPDDGFSADIVGALCSKYPGQWFGYMDIHGSTHKQRATMDHSIVAKPTQAL